VSSPAPAAVALQPVRAVGDLLKFQQHKLRHDHRALDDSRLGDVRDAPVNQHARVEQERPRALSLLAKLDVRDHESEIVLRLHDEADREIARDRAQQQVDVAHDRELRLVADAAGGHELVKLDRQRRDEAEPVGDRDADDQAQVQSREQREFSARGQDVNADDDHADRQRERHRHPDVWAPRRVWIADVVQPTAAITRTNSARRMTRIIKGPGGAR
jgi:hypothetical protein